MRRLVPLVLLFALCATSAFAQQPPKLTWLRFYQVAPGKDADFMRLLNDSSKAMFDKLIAEKKVAGWGVAVPLTHNDEPWTHVVYVGLADWAAAEALVKGVESSDAQLSAAEMKRMGELAMSSIKPGSVRDVILHHIAQSDTPPMAPPKYIGVDYYTVKQGRHGDAVALFNEWAKPLFTGVAAKGKLGAVGLLHADQHPGRIHAHDLVFHERPGRARRAQRRQHGHGSDEAARFRRSPARFVGVGEAAHAVVAGGAVPVILSGVDGPV